MDRYAAALHAAEPCHLTLGKLVNCNGKPLAHLVKSKFSEDILRDKFIFQTIAQNKRNTVPIFVLNQNPSFTLS